MNTNEMNEKDLQEQPKQSEEKHMKPGEKGFALFLLAIGAFFSWQSWLLYAKNPSASSNGAVPLFCSLMIVAFSIIIFITDWKKSSENTEKGLGNAFKKFLSYLFPFDVWVMILFVVIYCVALYVGLGFMIVTPIFLWGSMTFLSRGNYAKNILWTAICMAFIYVVFRMLFSVVLP